MDQDVSTSLEFHIGERVVHREHRVPAHKRANRCRQGFLGSRVLPYRSLVNRIREYLKAAIGRNDFGILTWVLPSFWRKQEFLLFILDEYCVSVCRS